MFKTENQKCYLAEVLLKVDGEKRMAHCKFQITPVTYELAAEISPRIADRIFRGSPGNYAPVLEMNLVQFTLNFDPLSMTFMRDPNYAVGRALIQEVEIKSLIAKRLAPEIPDFSLIFVAAFEFQDPMMAKDLVQLLHENVFLTFAPMQPGLFEDKDNTPAYMDLCCRLCEAPNPEFVTMDEKFAYCEKCECNKAEGEITRRIRDRVKAQAAVEDIAEETTPDSRATDPLLESDFNARNRQSRRRK